MLSYLDGASASMIAAAVAGGAAGVGVLFRMYYHRLLGVFSKQHRQRADAARAELAADEVAADEVDPESHDDRTPEHTR